MNLRSGKNTASVEDQMASVEDQMASVEDQMASVEDQMASSFALRKGKIRDYLNHIEVLPLEEKLTTIVTMLTYIKAQRDILEGNVHFRNTCITKMNEFIAEPKALPIRPMLYEFRAFVNGIPPIHTPSVGDSVIRTAEDSVVENIETYSLTDLQWDGYNPDGSSHWIYNAPREYK